MALSKNENKNFSLCYMDKNFFFLIIIRFSFNLNIKLRLEFEFELELTFDLRWWHPLVCFCSFLLLRDLSLEDLLVLVWIQIGANLLMVVWNELGELIVKPTPLLDVLDEMVIVLGLSTKVSDNSFLD